MSYKVGDIGMLYGNWNSSRHYYIIALVDEDKGHVSHPLASVCYASKPPRVTRFAGLDTRYDPDAAWWTTIEYHPVDLGYFTHVLDLKGAELLAAIEEGKVDGLGCERIEE